MAATRLHRQKVAKVPRVAQDDLAGLQLQATLKDGPIEHEGVKLPILAARINRPGEAGEELRIEAPAGK